MTSSRWHGHRPLSCLCCLGISNSRKHPSDYGISVSCGMLSLARAFEIDGAETTCLWNSPTLLGKVEVFGTQVSGGIWWNLFVEVCYQIAFTSVQRPWTMSRNCFKNYTHAHAQDDFSGNFNCILILAENHFFYEQSFMKVHISPPPPLPSSLKMAFSFFQLSGGNPFLGPS